MPVETNPSTSAAAVPARQAVFTPRARAAPQSKAVRPDIPKEPTHLAKHTLAPMARKP